MLLKSGEKPQMSALRSISATPKVSSIEPRAELSDRALDEKR